MTTTSALREVRMLGIPTDLWSESEEHFQDLMREFALIAATPSQTHPLPGRLVHLLDRMTTAFSQFSDDQNGQILKAANEGRATIDLTYRVPPEVRKMMVELSHILDEADEYCLEGEHLLTLATPPDCLAFRHWFFSQFTEQLVGAAPTPWSEWIVGYRSWAMSREDFARRELLELAITTAGIGTWDWNLVTDTLVWDDRLIELLGDGTEQVDGSSHGFSSLLHPEDKDRVELDIRKAIESGGEFSSEYRVVLRNEIRWIGARGRALMDEHGVAVRMLGAAWDASAHRKSEEELREVLESMSTGFISLDKEWQITYVNAETERIVGLSRLDLLGNQIWDVFPELVGSDFEKAYRHTMSTGEMMTLDSFYAPLNAWYEVRVSRNRDGIALYFLDITERHDLQEESANAIAKADLLARVTDELVSVLDPAAAVTSLAKLVVPTLAEWCIVRLLDDEAEAGDRHSLNIVGAWHADADLRDLALRYASTWLSASSAESALTRAMETAEPQLFLKDAFATLEPTLPSGPGLEMLRELNPQSVAILPLVGRNGPVGLLTLCNGPTQAPLSDEDVATALHVVDRAGLVLDNARLYRQQRELAEGLQRSLLTAPPEPDHLQIEVRYAPATEAAQVGGDWYDAFIQPDGATVLVIGDVVGHDTVAAAAMGQVRTLVRGISVATGAQPRDVLRQVDATMATLRVDATATAVVARLEQTDTQRANGTTELRWSNAGHPPPMVIDPEGKVDVLNEGVTDLLLGVQANTQRNEATVTLERGSTVLLYTDGLVERRGQSLEEGIDLLQKTLAELADHDLDTLCDELLECMLPANAEDDVALVAVRLHPQGTPRPPEAGPNKQVNEA